MEEAGGALRNRNDYRLHVLCEAETLLCLLPESTRRDAVLKALADLIHRDLKIKQEFYITKITRKVAPP